MNYKVNIIAIIGACLTSACASGTAGIDPTTTGCKELVYQVIEMSGESGPKVIELNNIQTLREPTVGYPSAACTATATTSTGDYFLEYGTGVSPQGKVIVSMSYPHGTG